VWIRKQQDGHQVQQQLLEADSSPAGQPAGCLLHHTVVGGGGEWKVAGAETERCKLNASTLALQIFHSHLANHHMMASTTCKFKDTLLRLLSTHTAQTQHLNQQVGEEYMYTCTSEHTRHACWPTNCCTLQLDVVEQQQTDAVNPTQAYSKAAAADRNAPFSLFSKTPQLQKPACAAVPYHQLVTCNPAA
jgi:hypothetical protein